MLGTCVAHVQLDWKFVRPSGKSLNFSALNIFLSLDYSQCHHVFKNISKVNSGYSLAVKEVTTW